MVLADREIVEALLKGDLVITPLINAKKQIGSSSVDIRLGTEFKLIKRIKQTHFDLGAPEEVIRRQIHESTEVVHIAPGEVFILHPGDFALGCTLEYLALPDYLAGRLEGRSTWGRAGLQIHSTAGLVDPGFRGVLTFELHNLGKLPLPLYAGVRIAQIMFHRCLPVIQSYNAKDRPKYADSLEIRDSMFYAEYEYQKILKYSKKEKTNIRPNPRTSV